MFFLHGKGWVGTTSRVNVRRGSKNVDLEEERETLTTDET